jgi:hypothetical protein
MECQRNSNYVRLRKKSCVESRDREGKGNPITVRKKHFKTENEPFLPGKESL